jgi:hypothetical protein
MTLGNIREQGVHHLIAYSLNAACRQPALTRSAGYIAVVAEKVPSARVSARIRLLA